jgi:hypothetical protein
MSCQRCGGMLAVELVAAMYQLVCGKVVMENRYCHCNDAESPVRAYPLGESRGARAAELSETPLAEGVGPMTVERIERSADASV